MLSKLIDEKVHPEDIATILGRHPVAVRRLLPDGYESGPRMSNPFGLTNETVPLRAKLGSIIAQMTEEGMSREEIGEITGLNKRESHRAERRPFSHDWTLSQIERTLKYDNTRTGRSTTLGLSVEDAKGRNSTNPSIRSRS